MIEYIEGKETLTCSFSVPLNTLNCSKLENGLCDKVFEAKVPVVFDLKGVDYIASSFLRICVKVSKKIGSENFSVINVSPVVKKVFKMSGFDKYIKVE